MHKYDVLLIRIRAIMYVMYKIFIFCLESIDTYYLLTIKKYERDRESIR